MSRFCIHIVIVAVAVAIGGGVSTASAQIMGACCDRYFLNCDEVPYDICEQYYPGREWMGVFTTCAEDCVLADQGACCNILTLDCYITYEDWCEIEVNYTWLGPDTSCDQCGLADTGACCDPTTGDCFQTSEQECQLYPSYIWLGLWVSCDECAQTLGACCNELTGECYITTATDCEYQYPGYTYLGDNSTCDECMAAEMGACCDEITGDCTETTEQECWDYYPGYSWLGSGSTCNECVGQELGSCCYQDGTCMDGMPQMDCMAQGGIWHGPGDLCSVSREACCLADGTCVDADPLCCTDLGGTSQGEYTGCVDTLIACCLPDGSCIDTDPVCCDDIGGVPGYAANCMGDLNGNEIDDACEEPIEYCPLRDGEEWCANFQQRDCESDTAIDENCMPRTVAVVAGGPLVIEECDCFGLEGCGAVEINLPMLSCPGDCPVPPHNDGDVCQIFINEVATGEVSVDIGIVPAGSLVTCDCAQVEEPEACCLPDGLCVNGLTPTACVERGGTPQGEGTVCSGTLEACCMPDGSCMDVDPLCCDELSGVPQGAGSGCVDMLVACCLDDGSCVDADPTCCDDMGGFIGYQANCMGDSNGNGRDDACEDPDEYCPVPATSEQWCANLQVRDCLNDGIVDDTCLPKMVMVGNGEIVGVEECDCFGPGGCGAVSIELPTLSCPGECPDPPYDPGDICQIHVNGTATGQSSIDIRTITSDSLVTCDCAAGPVELYAKWQQPPSCDEGFDAASDIWFHEEIPGIKWEQLPNTGLSGLHCHDIGLPGSAEYMWTTLADDWLCEGGLVTDLHWWGNYEGNYMGQGISYFHLSIHVDDLVPGPPHGLPVPQEPPVWQMDAPFNMISEVSTGTTNNLGDFIYRYDFILPEPFPQFEGTYYWLDICAYMVAPEADPPVVWRWQEARRGPRPVLGHAPAAESNNGGPWKSVWWDTVPPSSEYRYSDMAFRITSEPEEVQEVNKVVADDFISDGRPIEAVRWWGSYFDERYLPYEPIEPFIIDGWIISFHYGDPAILNPGCPPDVNLGDGPPTALGLYFAPASAVEVAGVDCTDCLGHSLYEYKVDLAQCTLICAEADPRNGVVPATAEAFLEEARFKYWLDIQAVVGAKWEDVTGAGIEMIYTGHMPSDLSVEGHFWGWHTSLANCLHEACTGEVILTATSPSTGSCWNYGNWDKQNWLCPTVPLEPHVNMAFDLMTGEEDPGGPSILDAVSRLDHGAGGVRDVPLIKDGVDVCNSNTECRRPSDDVFTFVVHFDQQILIVGTPTLSSGQLVDLRSECTELTIVVFNPNDRECLNIDLSPAVADFSGNVTTEAVNAVMLHADQNSDNAVNAADVVAAKAASGLPPVTESNFRSDIDVDGFANAADIVVTKSKSALGNIYCP